ncbi:hypothetical protein KCTC32516_01768 [Polaribacter huanghezhanensis]|uniref:DUF6702 family protein n=1 Tax=Polaribacter huanghezhanensis TaxID=1354726 RepID=UPI002648A2F2|nr:DUF6702 family protein [Polaribacter huanghezhanensis]WKD86393.1 hypothetical protein KCTC32516_01768 [Polaribacter huanghezhanensis]
MRTKKLLLTLFIIPLFAFTAHKYYLSLTQIEYNTKNKSVEVIINVFIDDLETAFDKIYNKRFELDTKNEPADSDKYFFEYLQKNVKFKINGKAYNYKYIGKEYDGDVVFFYLEIKNVPTLKDIEINNTILLEHFPEQQNLVKSKVNKKYKSVLLTKKEQTGILKY